MSGRPKQFETAQVLQAALHVFWSKGFAATSISDLVKAMGVGRQSLYNEFGDKRSLFVAALKNYDESTREKTSDILFGASSSFDGLQDFFEMVVSSHCTSESKGCFLNSSIAVKDGDDQALSDLMVSIALRMRDSLVEVVRKGVESGEFKQNLDPFTQGTLLFTLLQGLNVVGKCGESRSVLMPGVRGLLQSMKA